MNIATIRMTKSKGWNKLEELVQMYEPEFTFQPNETYKLQLLSGAVTLCESTDEPNNEGYLFHKINSVIIYKKGEGHLYIIPTKFEKASINIGDNK